jgi:hypothetical protein
MRASTECIDCILIKADHLYEEHHPHDANKLDFIQSIKTELEHAPEDASAPILSKIMLDRLKLTTDLLTTYRNIKHASNIFMLEWEEKVKEHIFGSADPIKKGLQYAMIGNFIDFGAMDQVDMDRLSTILSEATNQELELDEYERFRDDLLGANRLVYLLDNAGEIVMDKVFIETIKGIYPDLSITAIVRGEDVYNDATLEDAQLVGLTEVVPTIGNGTDYPGTELDRLPPDVLKIIKSADLILAKGQGNFESLEGRGLNIYFAFLCKCDLFTKRFQLERYSGVLMRGR